MRVTRTTLKTSVVAIATIAAILATPPAPGAAQPVPVTGAATVTSDGRTIPITPTGQRGTDGAFGAQPAAVPAAAVGAEAIGPFPLASAETILGADNRTKVSDTTNKPARMVVMLTYQGNQWCSGFVIGADTVVTSGHCVYNRSAGRFYDAASMRAYPAYDSSRTNPAPYGACNVRLLVTTSGWTATGSDEQDYGALKLSCTVGQQTGWFGWWYQTASLDGTQSRNHGYPADRTVTQWRTTDSIRVSEARRLYYANDTYGGNSGSPVFTKRASGAAQCAGWCVMAVHGYGTYGSYPNNTYNHGVRVTREVSDAFFAWRNL